MQRKFRSKTKEVVAVKVDINSEYGLIELKEFLGYRLIRCMTKQTNKGNKLNFVVYTNYDRRTRKYYNDIVLDNHFLFYAVDSPNRINYLPFDEFLNQYEAV